ncbi:hypothetical protein DSL72_004401 [Monilinia vaccinii-corymbosi]|uniref:Uncharacterized protein n=1 Tax=Monilinia vaccinii-corymbosi TaxID=61207 RepID=A0A8A3NWJ3_9HELO|nr:hypothetical protein DSL72_004401 [Monilinia vaccinii-corymbosi]
MEELPGCWREAARADSVATELLRIRNILTPTPPLLSSPSSSPSPSSSTSTSTPPPSSDYDIQTAIIRYVEQTSHMLRDLHDLFPVYRARIPMIIYYLRVILPCLQKSLMDMLVFLRCEDFAPRVQWERMHERLNQQGGLSLQMRFVTYADFLVQLVRLLTR